MLIDEAMDRLDCYWDPFSSVYESEPSHDLMQRAAFKRQAAEWEDAFKRQAIPAEQPEDEPPASASAIADASMLAMILRDALAVQLDYPEAGSTPQHLSLMKEVQERLARALDRPGMNRLKVLAVSALEIHDVPEPAKWSMFATAAATWHPQFADGPVNDAELEGAIKRALLLCQSTAHPEILALAQRLGEFMMLMCRRPTGSHDPAFKYPARAAYLLDRYWRLAKRLIHTHMEIHVGFTPHPLTRVIENLRDRIAGCFDLLKDQPDATAASEEADTLLKALSEGEKDDLFIMEEWAEGAIRRVELFIARMGMTLGIWHGKMTQAETFFVTHVEPLITEHTANVKAEWRKLQRHANAIGAQNAAQRGSDEGLASNSSSDAAGNSPPPPVQKGPRVVLGNRGEPCLVDGKEMPPLTDGRYAVIEALIKAGEDGLTKDAIEAVRGSARRMLEDLSELHPEWAAVIQMAGQTNGRYRIRL
ncbi:MAG: hypothetical protein KF838_04890 [Phycisphaeraceae bacterium]|nr:MAG: hypothetical protein KF838_04890 [Phycisphaeraceae bacterium]